MSNLVLLLLCFVAGILLRRFGRMPVDAPSALNSFIIHLSLPALTLLYIHPLRPSYDLLLIAAMAWLQFALGAGFFWLAGRHFSLPRRTVGALMLTGGLGNTSFFGLPMIEAFYGPRGIATGIVADQLGSFLVLSTLGLVAAGWYSSQACSGREILLRIGRFPPFISLLAALLLLPVDYAPWFTAMLQRLGDTLAPLALLSVGMQLRLGHVLRHKRNLAIGLGFKLLLAPLLLYLLYVVLLGANGLPVQVTIFEAAMPPMITAAIVAGEHDLDPELSVLMVAAGLLLSTVTLSLWWLFLRTMPAFP